MRARRVTVVLAPKLGNFSGSLPVNLLRGIAALHTALDRAVAAGCTTPLASQALLRGMVASFPLGSDVAQQMILGAYRVQESIDITGPVELGMTYALDARRPGRYDLGYVARLYRFRVHDRLGRGWLELRSAAVRDAPTRHPIPAPPIALPTHGPPVYLRLFFYLRIAPNQHDVALVAARTQAAMTQATAVLRQRPWACPGFHVPGADCVPVPTDDTLEARIAIRVQGRQEAVPLLGTVAQALQTAGASAAQVLPTLQVLRPWRGREIPVVVQGPRRQLLGLVLAGGEQITWK